MPIEIKELVIKTEVETTQRSSYAAPGQLPAEEMQRIVKQCVDQVMEILKEKKER